MSDLTLSMCGGICIGSSAIIERNRNSELVVRVMLESGNSRGAIPRNELEGIWDNVKIHDKESRFVNKSDRLNLFPNKRGGNTRSQNRSYILKLIQHMVGDQDME